MLSNLIDQAVLDDLQHRALSREGTVGAEKSCANDAKKEETTGSNWRDDAWSCIDDIYALMDVQGSVLPYLRDYLEAQLRATRDRLRTLEEANELLEYTVPSCQDDLALLDALRRLANIKTSMQRWRECPALVAKLDGALLQQSNHLEWLKHRLVHLLSSPVDTADKLGALINGFNTNAAVQEAMSLFAVLSPPVLNSFAAGRYLQARRPIAKQLFCSLSEASDRSAFLDDERHHLLALQIHSSLVDSYVQSFS